MLSFFYKSISNSFFDRLVSTKAMADDQDKQVTQEINKAINFLGQNKFIEAENTCLKIIESGKNADAFHILSSIKIYQQKFDDSIKYVKKSIDINSKNPGYHVTLGCAYSAKKDYESSVLAFSDAIKINSKVAQVHFYLGESYRKLKKYNDAISSFYTTTELSPDHTGAYMLLGVVYQEKKQFDLSIQSFQKCIEIMPDYAEAHLNLGLCYLLIGDYENGWREYEWRRKLYKTPDDTLSIEWSGQNLENKTLLVLDEGSNENLIHFIRFIRELKKENCRVIVKCTDEAQTLIDYQRWIDASFTGVDYPEHDFYIPIGSIMNVLKYNPNHHKQNFPYIEIDRENTTKDNSGNINIGVVFETDRASNAHDDESIHPSFLRNIFTENHNVICLDKYITKETLPEYCNEVINYSNLKELSQALCKLDLIITVDHIVAHLAGALNIDTILLLPCVPNWRWDMNFRDTSVWYKSFKVIRQQIPGDWSDVMVKLNIYISELKSG